MKSFMGCTLQPILLGVCSLRQTELEAAVTRMGKKRCVEGLVRKAEGKRRLGKPRRIWQDAIAINLNKIKW
jgi:hypothetical protein